MATFNIGSQNAASIQNIGGDAHIDGGLHASAQIPDLRSAIARLQAEVANVPLPEPVRESVNAALSAASTEAAKDVPDRGRTAELLSATARALNQAGALGAGATAVVTAIRHAAALVGPLGPAAIALL